MGKRAIPGSVLIAVGASLVTSLLYTLPSAEQGGPAVAWALSVAVLRGGGGILAAGVGFFSVIRGRVRLPLFVLAAYGTVGVVYFSIRFMLFPRVPMVLFTLATTAFAVLAMYAAFRLVNSDLLGTVLGERG